MKLEIINQKMTESSNIRLIKIAKESGIPLIGCIAFGIIDRGTNLLQVRCTSVCNMNCAFCSTAAGPYSKWHKTNYVVDVDYLVEEVEKVAKLKGEVIIFLDSVGEPMMHPDFVELVRKLRSIKEVKGIIVITNGTFLTKEKIDGLKEAGLSRINLSFHSLDNELAKKLFQKGIDVPIEDFNENLEKTKELLKERKPLFEPSFLVDDLYSRADILVPVGKDEWNVIEVKSATKVKNVNIQDVSFQKQVS